jgi:thiol-disulfide isomerase/thioredoxin
MLTKILACSAVLAIALSIPSRAQEAAAPTLKIGDSAPPIKVAKWIKGEPVKEFAKDKVYVVEFWATWCGPCRVSIPHLSELQKKYADKGVIMIGQDLNEPEDKVAPFVKEMGDKMDYRVAIEADGGMGKTWFEAAGQRGIPCAFIVNKEGQIAWIGHPMGMDKPLEQVVAGNWDIAKAAAEKVKEDELVAKEAKIGQALGAAAQAKDWKKFLQILDDAAKEDAAFGKQLLYARFRAQLELPDLDGAWATAGKMVDDSESRPQMLNDVAWTILTKPGIATRNLDLALKLAEKANAATEGKESGVLDTLARAHFEKGDIDKAIDFQTQAVANAGDSEKAQLQDTLKKYQAKKAQKP